MGIPKKTQEQVLEKRRANQEKSKKLYAKAIKTQSEQNKVIPKNIETKSIIPKTGFNKFRDKAAIWILVLICISLILIGPVIFIIIVSFLFLRSALKLIKKILIKTSHIESSESLGLAIKK